MNWVLPREAFLIVYGCFLCVCYLWLEPFFVYPVTAIALSATWEMIGWNGVSSVMTLLALFIATGGSVLFRAIQRRQVFTQKPQSESRALAVLLGGFIFVLLTIAVPIALVK